MTIKSITSRIILAAAIGFFAMMPAFAAVKSVDAGDAVSLPALKREGDKMTASLVLDLASLNLKRTEAVVFLPMIVNGLDTLKLDPVSVYGRNIWYTSRRNHRMPLGGVEGRTLRYERNLAPEQYSRTVQYQPWMNGAQLEVQRTDYGCAGCQTSVTRTAPLAGYRKIAYEPTFVYLEAVAEKTKTRELSGRAYIDFPVNKTEIYPDYRNNHTELGKIIATIDSVKNDKDITVTSIAIKGFASPEGSYANNERLARGRTEALKNYVQRLYLFQPGFIKTAWEPEDWAGLREWIDNSTLPNKYELLAVIDDPTLEPDTKDWRLKLRFPEDYAYLLATVYPALRHSDYRIEYDIRIFSDPVEIRELMRTEPGKLNLSEIYLAAQGLQPGSDEYNEIFETAVRLFPGEPIANLNAANAAMQRGDLVGAQRYLDRAGTSPQATYARGVYAALNGEYEEALRLVEKAYTEGLPYDGAVIAHLKEVME